MGKQAGIPLFYLQGMGGGALLKFRDLFNDASIYWGWKQWKGTLDTTHKNVQEINGQMLLSVEGGYRGYWDENYAEAPEVIIGTLTYPCEVVTRLDEVTSPINDDTFAGLFISKAPMGFGSASHFSIGRCRKDTPLGVAGLAVLKDGYTILNHNAVTTLPVWLRMRIGNITWQAAHVYFDYSLDGLTWVNMYEWKGEEAPHIGFSINPASVGLCVINGLNLDDGGTTNGIHGKFDFFQMKPQSIN